MRFRGRYYLITAKHVWYKSFSNMATLTVLANQESPQGQALGIKSHVSAKEIAGLVISACDFTVFEINDDSYELLDPKAIPEVTLASNVALQVKIDAEMAVIGYPHVAPFIQIDYDSGSVTPRRLILPGRYGGKSKMAYMGIMDVTNKWVTADKITFPVTMPAGINGICGSPVVVTHPRHAPRIAGMIIMAGTSSIQFIEIGCVIRLLGLWIDSRNRASQ